MSDGPSLPFREAYVVAERAAAELQEVAERVKCVGSLRRRRAHVSDVEFAVEPHQVEVDLLGAREPDTEAIRATLEGMGEWVKGGDRMMQITHAYGCEGFHIEAYLVHPPAGWGSIVAIRTGPADLGRLCVTRMRDRGYRHRGGHVIRMGSGEKVPTPEESDFFRLASVPCVPPHQRDGLLAELQEAVT